jgi:hypothetical protein
LEEDLIIAAGLSNNLRRTRHGLPTSAEEDLLVTLSFFFFFVCENSYLTWKNEFNILLLLVTEDKQRETARKANCAARKLGTAKQK